MSRNQIGSAWNRTYGGDQRLFIGGVFDLGVLGELSFAAFPNKYHDPQRRTPTHHFVVSLPSQNEAGKKERVQVGAGWSRPGHEAGQTYISFILELHKLGARALPAVDFSKNQEPIYGRLVKNAVGGKRGPDYLLFRAQRRDGVDAAKVVVDAKVDQPGEETLSDDPRCVRADW